MKRLLVSMLMAVVLAAGLFAISDDAKFTYEVLSDAPEKGIPYTENAVKTAMETGTIRFYFMCGDGLIMSKTDGTKWGDSTLIVMPDGQTMLIDAGMEQYGTHLVENLRTLGIEKLDYVVVSHNHPDHFGGLVVSGGVFDSIPVGTLIWSGLNCDAYNKSQAERWNQGYNRVLAKGTKEVVATAGYEFSAGDVSFVVLNPTNESIEAFRSLNTGVMSEKHNSESIALKLTYSDFSAIFCGDMYQDREEEMVARYGDVLDVDLVKANHHGKDSSNGEIWGRATSPRVVACMYGYQMQGTAYGNYAKFGAYCFMDYFDGYIRVITDGKTCCNTTVSKKRRTPLFVYYDLQAQQIYPQN
ncbi:MAG: MBL fold metallo-hydrolase [Spirochaetales bacterium]|nr:MBL fold metallo-hydrolase [Spirochaetales bacterium]